MADKKYRVWLHFNRNNMRQGDSRVWTVHFRNTCYQVTAFTSYVTLESSYKPKGRQPRAILRGWAQAVLYNNDGTVFIA